jgi:hypothetical protein
MEGWIKLHRQICNSEEWFLEPFTKAQAWIDLILNANHKKGFFEVRGNVVTIKRGQIGWSEITMAKRWTWSRTKVRRYLKWLKTIQRIEQQNIQYITSIITIIHYEKYQIDTADDTADDTAEKQQKNSRRYTNKNDKNEKNIIINNNTEIQNTEPIKKTEYGNKYINLILDSFKNIYGFDPIDRKPRWVASTLFKTMARKMETNKKTDENYRLIINDFFSWIGKQKSLEGVKNLDTLRRNFPIYYSKI